MSRATPVKARTNSKATIKIYCIMVKFKQHDNCRTRRRLTTKMFVSPHALTSRVVWHVTEKGWSSDFPPLPSAFSPKRAMALLSGSHNGVHCCGTVGDSHSSSQLSTAKCTFTGDSFQNCATKLHSFFERAYIFPINY